MKQPFSINILLKYITLDSSNRVYQHSYYNFEYLVRCIIVNPFSANNAQSMPPYARVAYHCMCNNIIIIICFANDA